MKTTKPNTSRAVNYRVQEAIEQMVTTVPKGTDLGMCDVISAMYSGYFVESGGGITPAVDRYLSRFIDDEQERAARSRRAAKAVTYGQLNLAELLDKLKEKVDVEGKWQPTKVQGYKLKPVDMTACKRTRVKGLKSKTYDSGVNKEVVGVPYYHRPGRGWVVVRPE